MIVASVMATIVFLAGGKELMFDSQPTRHELTTRFACVMFLTGIAFFVGRGIGEIIAPRTF